MHRRYSAAELTRFRPGWNARLLAGHAPGLEPVAEKYKARLLADIEAGRLVVEESGACLCGGGDFLPLAATDRFGLPFGSLLCTRCGLVLTSPRLAEASLPRYYNEIYHPLVFGTERIAEYVNFTGYGQGRLVWERLSPHLGRREALRVLEIGAGTGSVLHEMREAALADGCRLEPWGFEYSRDCLDIAASRFGITLLEGGCAEALALGRSFDCVVLSHVLEHVSDLPAFLADVRALMRDGTLLYVEVPGLMVLHKSPWYEYDFLKYAIHAHTFAFTRQTLVGVLRRFGLADIASDELAYGIFAKGERTPDEDFAAVDLVAYLAFVERELGYLQGKETLAVKTRADDEPTDGGA
ncbi:class I SAM-dependent methyltransferase [Solidesulfovibrio sp.]|uniref:class I SAM-dependent methyltransferase n=1 Tax=Solidesulfovibrio sp. TaxID=2910990 RepID=UPI00262E3C84|nr:class I SAM-dependent methyltransferase [Solidesulfovibrio sp.]